MVNDRSAVEFHQAVAQAQELLADIAAVQRRQTAVTGSATVAHGMVQVSVNARGVVIDTIIDDAYLDDYDMEDLGHHITDAAQQAAATVHRRTSALMEPLKKHREDRPSMPQIISSAMNLRYLDDFESHFCTVGTASMPWSPRFSRGCNPIAPDDEDDNPWPEVRAQAVRFL